VLAQQRRDLPSSRAAVREALELAEAGSEPIVLIWPIEQIAALAAVPRPEAAVHLANLAGRLRERFGTPAWPAEHARLERLLDAARERLGGGPHGGETVPGGALTPTALASVAHAVLNSLEAPQRRHEGETGRALTPRELVVARLAASGRTNRSIAHELLISEGTVRVHVEHILHKLELKSRHELARRLPAIEAGID
jgi:DNA-binding CsgD family transcriptional regulator